MDKTKILDYGKWIIAHGVVWVLVYKFGFEKIQAEGFGDNISAAILSLIGLCWSIWDSYKGRQKVKGG